MSTLGELLAEHTIHLVPLAVTVVVASLCGDLPWYFAGRRYGYRILRTLKQQQSTVLLIEQNIGLAALVCSRFYIMRAGRVVHEDQGTALKADAAELGRRYYL